MGGVSYLDSVRNLVTEAETNWDAVLGRLRSMQRKLLARDKMVVNLSGDNKLLEKVPTCVLLTSLWPMASVHECGKKAVVELPVV